MSRLSCALLLGASLFVCIQSAMAVEVDRVRRCTGRVFCSGETAHDYRFWEDADVPRRMQKRTYIARYATPSRADTRYLVFIADGQRWGSGRESLLTGAAEGYTRRFGRRDGSRWIDEAIGSYPRRLIGSGIFPDGETFVAAAWDARFNFGFRRRNKARIIDAYMRWLSSRYHADRLETIYLAGHSRGGALVLELAERFQERHPQIPVVVHVLDGVAHHRDGELGVSSARIANPLGAGRAYRIDFGALFPDRRRLRVFNQVSGAQVLADAIDWIAPVHAFAAPSDRRDDDNGWLRQLWTGNSHGGFSMSVARLDAALEDLRVTLPPMAVERVATLPPMARCRVELDRERRVATFIDGESFSRSGEPIVSYRWSLELDRNLVRREDGRGPHVLEARPGPLPRRGIDFAADLIVTDALGNSASTRCAVDLRERCVVAGLGGLNRGDRGDRVREPAMHFGRCAE